jgi:hypothetical protein
MKRCFFFTGSHLYLYNNTKTKVLIVECTRMRLTKHFFPFSQTVNLKAICFDVLIIFVLSTTAIAQNTTVMSKPAKYEEQPDGALVEGKPKYSNKLWLVFSDRDNNTVYNSPSYEAAVAGTVGYMDKFYVTGESGDYLQLYKWKDEMGIYIRSPDGTTQLNPMTPVPIYK